MRFPVPDGARVRAFAQMMTAHSGKPYTPVQILKLFHNFSGPKAQEHIMDFMEEEDALEQEQKGAAAMEASTVPRRRKAKAKAQRAPAKSKPKPKPKKKKGVVPPQLRPYAKFMRDHGRPGTRQELLAKGYLKR